MKKLKYCLNTGASLGLLFGITLLAKAQAVNFDEGLKLAKEQNRKIIVDVYTDWCGWCKRMDKDTYGNAEVKKIIEENFILVRLDAEGGNKHTYNGKEYSDPELAALFEVTGYPTTVFLSPEGKIIEFDYDKYKMKNLPGYLPSADFKKVLEYFKEDKYKDTDLSRIM